MSKKFAVVFVTLLFAISPCVQVSAAELSPEQAGAISQNCQSIKQSLKNLQKTDSRTRVYLGSIYQNLLTDFITPLNLRLVRNNLPNTTLVDSQSSFTAARDQFAHDFVTYSQHLEELIATDCQNSPAGFYEKLTNTRTHREAVSKDVAKLKQLISDHLVAVKNIKEEQND